jgi:hypothetical protein
MAVVLKINPGFDASYPWRQIGRHGLSRSDHEDSAIT